MKGFLGIFKEADGQWSMRRVLAFALACAGIVSGIQSFGQEWQVVAASFGIPIAAALILLFFTTWSDIAAIINAAKK